MANSFEIVAKMLYHNMKTLVFLLELIPIWINNHLRNPQKARFYSLLTLFSNDHLGLIEFSLVIFRNRWYRWSSGSDDSPVIQTLVAKSRSTFPTRLQVSHPSRESASIMRIPILFGCSPQQHKVELSWGRVKQNIA